jgi:hypothetical protein
MHTLEKFKKELQDEGHFVPERMDDATLLRYVQPISYIDGSIGMVPAAS